MSGALGSRLSQLETWSELSRSFGKLKFSCSDELYRGASSGCGHQFSVSLALIQSVLEWCSVGAWFLVVRVYLVGQILCISDCHMYRVGTLPLKSLYYILSTWYHEFRVSFLYLRLPLPPPAPPPGRSISTGGCALLGRSDCHMYRVGTLPPSLCTLYIPPKGLNAIQSTLDAIYPSNSYL